jgi:nicotinate-nucleotide pyrophosphorylase (carboxylating)
MTVDVDLADARHVVESALAEDLRFGPDITTRAVVAADVLGVADLVPRVGGVLAGTPLVPLVLTAVAQREQQPTPSVTVHVQDGSRVEAGVPVLTVHGGLRTVLTAERTVLNLLGRLSGVATATRAWVDAVAGTGVAIRDTRKTTPGLRALEKYAVRCGGGVNHRFGLGDVALVKDNHVAAAGGVAAALAAVRAGLAAAGRPDVPVQVECDTLEQVVEALAAGATDLLLDNMSPVELRTAVATARRRGAVTLEASGGLRLQDAHAVAATGVNSLAIGALTHSAGVLDLGLDLRPAG